MQNPALLQPFLTQLGQTNPQLLQMISRNQEAFVQLLQGESGGDFDPAALGTGGEGGPQYIEVSESDRAAIDRLVGLGFHRDVVLQAFLACDRNEELAANYLLEHGFDEDDGFPDTPQS